MATTTNIKAAETWETVYTAFQTINFTSFDYSTIKQSLLNYVQLYYPEDFNDYIESSEFIALIETFAYVGELMAYRIDMNAHENFIDTAQRKESILRLAKLISYNPSRNLPNRGLVKITSIMTSEHVYDINGTDLSNVKIIWNDANNSIWKEQFLQVLNLVLDQNFGTVSPNERIQVENVLFELYTLNNNPLNNGVFPYTVNISGNTIPMELVPVNLDENGPYEKTPDSTSSFSLLYGSDGLGDGSDTTGFFLFTKQGTLASTTTTFDGVTPNQTFDINVDNINEIDLWVNNIDATTGAIVDDGSNAAGPSGAWESVDLAYAQNIIYNTNPNRNKYEVETLDNDQVRLIFGDGEFANIPSGTFQIWYRTSVADTLVIPINNVNNISSSFTYQDQNNTVQTLTFNYSLINTLQNNSPSEDIDHIRQVAPSVYYSQDRMVNAQDYNTFMLQDPSILKLLSVNRTYAGDSKYIAWHDSSETYEDVKIFGDDLAIYYEDSTFTTTVNGVSDINVLISNYIEPILSSSDIFTILTSRGVNPLDVRNNFTSSELTNINNVLTFAATQASLPATIQLYYSIVDNAPYGRWDAQLGTAPTILTEPLWDLTTGLITVTANSPSSWSIVNRAEKLIANSQKTKFWNTNDGTRIISYNTLGSVYDQITVLKANTNNSQSSILSQNWKFNVLSQVNENGLPNLSLLNVLPVSSDGSGIPDNMTLPEIIDPSYTVTQSASLPAIYDLPFVALHNDISNNAISNFDLEYHFIHLNNLVGLWKPPADVATTANINLSGGTPNIIDDISLSTEDKAVFTAGISGTTVTVSGITSGTIEVGQLIKGSGVVPGSTIISTTGTTTSGYQIISSGTNGYQVVDSGAHSGSDSTGLIPTTVYTATITIDGTSVFPVSILGSDASTYDTLKAALEVFIPTGVAQIGLNGSSLFQITSLTTGPSSSVDIVDTDLFSSLLGFITIDAAVAGESTTSTATGLANDSTNYTSTITVDGINYTVSITGSDNQTYLDLIANLQTQLGTIAIVNLNGDGNLVITSATTGLNSNVSFFDSGTNHLFENLAQYNGGLYNQTVNGTATYTLDSTQSVVPGTTITSYVGTRILVKDQTTTTENGIYQVSELGTGIDGTWVRTIDAADGGNVSGLLIYVQSGTNYENTEWQLPSSSAVFVGDISGTTLTVTSISNGSIIIGQTITGAGISANTIITDFVSGVNGGIGVYTVNNSQTVSSETIETLSSLIVGTNGLIFDELTVPIEVDQIQITSLGANDSVTITVKEYVYFNRATTIDDWLPQETPTESNLNSITSYLDDTNRDDPIFGLWKREHGRYPLNFAWFHFTPNYHLIDPSSTNIIDMFIITNGYFSSLQSWLNGTTTVAPSLPTPFELKNDYGYLLNNKMISDTVILHPGKFKLLFGSKADQQLQATFAVVVNPQAALTNNQIKVKIVQSIKNYFDISNWSFGQTFYATELISQIHNDLGSNIETVVLVPTFSQNYFGDLFEVYALEDEILYPSISVDNISIVTSLNPQTLRQNI